jgi:hypothetical protein
MLTRSPSPNVGGKGKAVAQGHKGGRKRSKSPSRSKSRHGSPSPHLRRVRTRSRSRTLDGGKQKKGVEGQLRGSTDGVQRRRPIGDKHSEDSGNQYRERRDQGPLQDKRYSDNGRLGPEGGSADTGGEVKFKGRGSMKYRERKW